MKATFIHKNHEIVVDKQLSSVSLFIDGVEVDKKEGFFSIQNTNYELNGKVAGSETGHDTVKIQFRYGLVVDEVIFLYNDEKIDVKRII